MPPSPPPDAKAFGQALALLTGEQLRRLFEAALRADPRFSDVSSPTNGPPGSAMPLRAFDSHKDRLTFYEFAQATTVHPDLVSAVADRLSPLRPQHPNADFVLVTVGLATRDARELAIEHRLKLYGYLSLHAVVPWSLAADFLVDPGPSGSETVLDRLATIEPGRGHASVYEQWVGDALTTLFCPPLGDAMRASGDRERRNVRDLVFPNQARDGFWADVRYRYAGDYIVVDAKNLSEPVGKDEVLQVAHYLKRHGAGLYGMIVSRLGPGDAGTAAIREQWSSSSKMIVVMSDDEMREMLDLGATGGDPAATIQRAIMNFRLSL